MLLSCIRMEYLQASLTPPETGRTPQPAPEPTGSRFTGARARSRGPVRTVTVASGKGGVGKTNVVANLAVALRAMGQDVLILDADMGSNNLDVLLHLSPQRNIAQVLSGEMRLEDVVVDGPHGIKVLPGAFGAQELTRLDRNQRMRLLEAFDAYDADVDVLLIDTPAGISENVAFFCVASRETLVVTVPEPTAAAGARALIDVLSTRYREKRFTLLVNSARSEADALEAYRVLSATPGGLRDVSLDYIGYIPLDASVQDAVRSQAPFIDMFPDGPASRSVREIASRILERPGGDVKGTLQFFLENLFSAAAGE